MSSKSKTKGKSWERDVCLYLSALYNDSLYKSERNKTTSRSHVLPFVFDLFNQQILRLLKNE